MLMQKLGIIDDGWILREGGGQTGCRDKKARNQMRCRPLQHIARWHTSFVRCRRHFRPLDGIRIFLWHFSHSHFLPFNSCVPLGIHHNGPCNVSVGGWQGQSQKSYPYLRLDEQDYHCYCCPNLSSQAQRYFVCIQIWREYNVWEGFSW